MPPRKVDPNDPMPRYYQIYTSLLDRIQSSEFAPGSVIPTERELGEEYGVSRITVIKALDMLERDGHVVRQQGRGTFVADPAGRVALTFGTPAEVAEQTRWLCRHIGADGGFILSTCNILIDAIPIENAIAMYGAAD